MSIEVFKNQTINITTDPYDFDGGFLQVDIKGVLDGADVKTVFINNNGDLTPIEGIADLSWRASKGEILTTTDGGIRFLNKRHIKFIIENAGASTNISLWYDNLSQR